MMKINTITNCELKQKIEVNDDLIIIDVCEDFEYHCNSLPNAINLPIREFNVLFETNFGDLPKDKEIVVICAHGLRSARAVAYLMQLGFTNAKSLVGGLVNY